jgi:quinol monooxygenase YgiN
MPHALFVRHKAQPGCREKVQQVWEKHVKPRAAANPQHLAYYFCHDAADADVVCVFQLYTDEQAMKDFLSGDWYPAYLAEVPLSAPHPRRCCPRIPCGSKTRRRAHEHAH